MSRSLCLALVAGSLLAAAGCRHAGWSRPLCRSDAPPAKTFVPPGAPVIVSPGGPTIVPPVQQQAFPTIPGNPVIVPGNPQPPSITPVSPGDPRKAHFEPNWKPAEAFAPSSKEESKPRVQLYAPEPLEPDRTGEPPINKKPDVQAIFPAIPQFTSPKDNIFAGLRPPVDGFDWLQRNSVKTVVNVHAPGEDDSADRKQVESRGLRYVSFEISPLTLTKARTEEFIKVVRDGSKEGVFAYDRDGSLAGSMWYLFLRWSEFVDDEPAQLRARALGLQINRDGAHRDMWLAVQRVLSE